MFFVLNTSKMTREDFVEAMFMLSYYHVSTRLYSDGEKASSAYMIVEMDRERYGSEGNGDDDVRLAEMGFQMNFHQDNNLVACPHCDEEDGPCGHLTFSRKIKSAF